MLSRGEGWLYAQKISLLVVGLGGIPSRFVLLVHESCCLEGEVVRHSTINPSHGLRLLLHCIRSVANGIVSEFVLVDSNVLTSFFLALPSLFWLIPMF